MVEQATSNTLISDFTLNRTVAAGGAGGIGGPDDLDLPNFGGNPDNPNTNIRAARQIFCYWAEGKKIAPDGTLPIAVHFEALGTDYRRGIVIAANRGSVKDNSVYRPGEPFEIEDQSLVEALARWPKRVEEVQVPKNRGGGFYPTGRRTRN